MDEIKEEKRSGQSSTSLEKLTASNDMLAEIFSFVPGPEVIHKVALLSKRIRDILIKNKARLSFKITLKVGPSLIVPYTE